MAKISARHALTDAEVNFCKYFIAGGGQRLAGCYTKAFCVRRPNDLEWVEPTFSLDDVTPERRVQTLNQFPPLAGDQILQRAKAKLRDENIKAYLAELDQGDVQAAEMVLAEQVRFGDDRDARSSAAEILKRDQRANMRDDILYLAQVLEDAGAEVVLELPTEVRKDVVCRHCHATFHVAFPVEAVGKWKAPPKPAEPEAREADA